MSNLWIWGNFLSYYIIFCLGVDIILYSSTSTQWYLEFSQKNKQTLWYLDSQVDEAMLADLDNFVKEKLNKIVKGCCLIDGHDYIGLALKKTSWLHGCLLREKIEDRNDYYIYTIKVN